MARAKNRKTGKKRNYARNNDLYYENGEEENAEDSSETGAYKVPPALASYALSRSSQIPPALRKYWKQRRTLFSYFDGTSPSGMLPLLDEQSWFSVTPEAIAARISQRCRSNVVLDAFCGAGGNAIQFAHTCHHVVAIDIDPVKLLLARHNAEVYDVQDKITFLLGDWRDFVEDWARSRQSAGQVDGRESRWMGCESWNIDVVFLSPPWGGIDYRIPLQADEEEGDGVDGGDEGERYIYYPLSRLEPTGGKAMYELARQLTPNICMYLPRTIDLTELATLVGQEERRQENTFLDVEEQWLDNRCKAIACYFGELIAGGGK